MANALAQTSKRIFGLTGFSKLRIQLSESANRKHGLRDIRHYDNAAHTGEKAVAKAHALQANYVDKSEDMPGQIQTGGQIVDALYEEPTSKAPNIFRLLIEISCQDMSQAVAAMR